jgi:thiamine-phosphate pyrophosphorylase
MGWNSGEKVRFPKLYPILDAELVFRELAPRAAGTQPSTESKERETLLRRLVRELARAGVEILQYRNKRDDDKVVLADALAIREGAKSLGQPRRNPMRLILNDRVELVAAAGWDGVHVGQEDLSPQQARLLAGPGAIVGLSTHTAEQVVTADAEPVDYVAIGPVFATATKPDTSPVIGLEGVRRARALTGKPLVAIGGITRENAAAVYEAGADSVAVISAIFGAQSSGESVADSVRQFRPL